MPTSESDRVRRIFDEVADLPPTEQAAGIDRLCGDDRELRLRVEALIGASNPDRNDTLPTVINTFLTASEEEPLEGRTLGHFRILRLIGQGGMGRVYLGEDLRLSREVAIKFLPTRIAHRSDLVELFRTEAQIASGLKHANIVTIHDVDEAEGYHFIVMELIKGRTLREKLLEEGALKTEEICRLSVPMLSALHRAHRAGITHCDIKPENVMFDEENAGDGYNIKVLDFGLARLGITINQEGTTLQRGTPEYASPEQRAGAGVDARSDVYSFGVMLHEMAYGSRPGVGVPNDPAVPAEISRIISGCIAADPADRYQSVSDLLDEFRLLEEASQRRKRRRLSLGAFKRREAAAAAILCLLSILAIVTVTSISPPPFNTESVTTLSNITPHQWAYLAPDGDHIVFDQERDSLESVWVMNRRNNSRWQILEPRNASYRWPTISNDSQYVFLVQSKDDGKKIPGILIRVPLAGGAVEKIAARVDSPIGFSPDGKRYAFVVEDPQKGYSELRVGSLGETSSRVLSTRRTPDAYTLDGPAWSPDGKTIATTFCSVRNGAYYDVVGIDVETGRERTLTGQKWGHVLGINWLPDGSWLVVNGKDRGSDMYHHLYFVKSDSKNRQLVPRANGELDYRGRPSVGFNSEGILAAFSNVDTSFWVNTATSPQTFVKYDTGFNMDGYEGTSWLGSTQLAFTSRVNGSENIWVSDLNGNSRQVTHATANNRYPVTSPDGRYIVFSSDQLGKSRVYRIDADGRNQIELSNGFNDMDPQVSPDGRWVVYTSENGDLRTLWRVSIDGGEPIQLSTKWAESPTISPDGRSIACIYDNGPQSAGNIAIIPMDGGEPTAFLNIQPPSYPRYRYFRWSPDGTGLDYVAVKNGVGNIWRLPFRGGQPQQLANFDLMSIHGFRWSADGARLVVTRADNALKLNLIHRQRASNGSAHRRRLLAAYQMFRLADPLYPDPSVVSPGGSESSVSSPF